MTTDELKAWAQPSTFMDDSMKEVGAAVLALIAERDEARASDSTARRMFDVTRHRVCDRLGLSHGTSWSNVEDAVAAAESREKAAESDAKALRARVETLVTCDMYRHGALLGLVHVQTNECVRPRRAALAAGKEGT